MKVRTVFLLLVLSVLACDQYAEDTLPILNARLEISPNTAIIINPSQFMNRQIGDVRLISEPLQGSLEVIDGQSFLKYTPVQNFLAGEDSFRISTTDLQGGVREVNVTVEIDESTCVYRPVFDYVSVQANRSVTVDLFANDDFCGNVLDVRSSEIVQNNIPTTDFTNLDWISLSLDENTDQALLQVEAGNEVGVVKMLYEIGINLKAGDMPYFEGNLALNPNAYEHYFIAEVTVEVTR